MKRKDEQVSALKVDIILKYIKHFSILEYLSENSILIAETRGSFSGVVEIGRD